MSARIEHQLREVGGALAAQGRDRLADLERVPDRLAERLVHVGEHADDFAARMLPKLEHHLRELARVVDGLHERPVADLDVEHDRIGTGCDLLRHDARGDQRHVVDGRRHVAQPVEELVGRNEVRGLPDDRKPDLPHLLEELFLRELDPETGDRLELVERAAGVAETAAAHLPEGNAARCDDRADGERRLVPHATGRVLVDNLASERRAEIDRLAAADHRVGQRERLFAVQALEEDRHAEGSHLVIGHVAPGIREHELGQLVPAELLAVALSPDQLRRHGPRAGGQCSTIGWPGIPREGDLPPSQRFTVAPTSANSPS